MTTAIVERTITAFLDGDDSLEINNIIHSTAGAARYGYSGARVGGTTVYSWSAGALVEALGEAWLDEGWVEFQLRKPVYPDEVITTRVTANGGDVEFTMTKNTGDVAVRGTAGLGVADFLTEISTAADRTPVPQPTRGATRRSMPPAKSSIWPRSTPISSSSSAGDLSPGTSARATNTQ